MSVGDLDSNEKGSAARFNDGKTRWDLIPVRLWIARWKYHLEGMGLLHGILIDLQKFQEGDDHALEHTLAALPDKAWEDGIGVLEYGAKKYKAWNWAKGQAWSIPIGCIGRHAHAIVAQNNMDAIDKGNPEEHSNLPHMGHIVANLVFLAWFVTHYQDGDDRPPVFLDVRSLRATLRDMPDLERADYE